MYPEDDTKLLTIQMSVSRFMISSVPATVVRSDTSAPSSHLSAVVSLTTSMLSYRLQPGYIELDLFGEKDFTLLSL